MTEFLLRKAKKFDTYSGTIFLATCRAIALRWKLKALLRVLPLFAKLQQLVARTRNDFIIRIIIFSEGIQLAKGGFQWSFQWSPPDFDFKKHVAELAKWC